MLNDVPSGFTRLSLALYETQIVLETEVDNAGALSLYESLGFIREKRLYRFYLNGAWLQEDGSLRICSNAANFLPTRGFDRQRLLSTCTAGTGEKRRKEIGCPYGRRGEAVTCSSRCNAHCMMMPSGGHALIPTSLRACEKPMLPSQCAFRPATMLLRSSVSLISPGLWPKLPLQTSSLSKPGSLPCPWTPRSTL